MMKKRSSLGFWELVARVVIRNKALMLSLIAIITILLAMQWKNIHFTHTEANLLPADNIVNIEYNAFLNKFGEEGNLIVIGLKNDALFTPKIYSSWVKLMNTIKSDKDIDLVISLNDLKKLQKNETQEKFELVPFIDQSKKLYKEYLLKIKHELFNNLPFYEGLLFNKRSGTIRSAVYMDKK